MWIQVGRYWSNSCQFHRRNTRQRNCRNLNSVEPWWVDMWRKVGIMPSLNCSVNTGSKPSVSDDCRSRVTYCRPKQSYKLSNTVQQIDFPRVFHMWSCIQWSFGGNRVVGLNGLPVILPRVMHISTDEVVYICPSVCTSVRASQPRVWVIPIVSSTSTYLC
jgi:hypothetical protein